MVMSASDNQRSRIVKRCGMGHAASAVAVGIVRVLHVKRVNVWAWMTLESGAEASVASKGCGPPSIVVGVGKRSNRKEAGDGEKRIGSRACQGNRPCVEVEVEPMSSGPGVDGGVGCNMVHGESRR